MARQGSLLLAGTALVRELTLIHLYTKQEVSPWVRTKLRARLGGQAATPAAAGERQLRLRRWRKNFQRNLEEVSAEPADCGSRGQAQTPLASSETSTSAFSSSSVKWVWPPGPTPTLRARGETQRRLRLRNPLQQKVRSRRQDTCAFRSSGPGKIPLNCLGTRYPVQISTLANCCFYMACLLPVTVVGTLLFISGLSPALSPWGPTHQCGWLQKGWGMGWMGQVVHLVEDRPSQDRHPLLIERRSVPVELSCVFDHPGTVFFSIFMSFWAMAFLEHWKQGECPHLEFAASALQMTQNPVTDLKELYFPPHSCLSRLLTSSAAILTVAGNIANISSTVLSQFVSFYSSPFYMAFFKGSHEALSKVLCACQQQRGPGGCHIEVTQQLIIIMVGKQLLSHMEEFAVLSGSWQGRGTPRSGNSCSAGRRKDYELIECQGLFDEYPGMEEQSLSSVCPGAAVWFITIFVVAFLLAPLFALLNNWVEIRLDAHKFLCEYQRPVAGRSRTSGSDCSCWRSWYTLRSPCAEPARVLAERAGPDSREEEGRKCRVRNRDPRASPDPATQIQGLSRRGGEPRPLLLEGAAVHLGFIIAFEHVVFFLQCPNARLVPDVPALATKITREGYLAKQAVAVNGEALPSVSKAG
ncbi:PREDICTED: anoctamin-7 [Colobus angolensis palliatus]|uniref:anoctamin-7 n=1 Tax=Colobus angolensis palliatus TaxID=336983 RepID=UPI0005F520D9|nr:PREDICTED: anoctamin-7 [Colobus angolensis palliatus]